MGLFSWLRGNRSRPHDHSTEAPTPPPIPTPEVSPPEDDPDSMLDGFDAALGKTLVEGEGRTALVTEEPTADETSESMPEGLEPEGFDNLVEDFFDTATTGGDTEPETASSAALDDTGLSELRETFGGIAAGYVRPVRQFHARLLKGPVATDWVDLCRPAIDTVARSAAGMGLGGLTPPLERFEALLHRARQQGAREIAGEDRDAVLAAYSELAAHFPEAFAVKDDSDHRDSVIVQAVLRRIPEIGRVSLDKIFAAGLTNLELLEKATPEDLSVTTGVPADLALAVCDGVRLYWDETAPLRNGAPASRGLDLLSSAVDELERQHKSYEELGSAHHTARDRKQSRVGRRNALLHLDALLAEMGEVELVDELQRLPVEHRIVRVRGLLDGMPITAQPDALNPASTHES